MALKTVSIDPVGQCVRLDNDSEVIVEPKKRIKAIKGFEAVKRVQPLEWTECVKDSELSYNDVEGKCIVVLSSDLAGFVDEGSEIMIENYDYEYVMKGNNGKGDVLKVIVKFSYAVDKELVGVSKKCRELLGLKAYSKVRIYLDLLDKDGLGNDGKVNDKINGEKRAEKPMKALVKLELGQTDIPGMSIIFQECKLFLESCMFAKFNFNLGVTGFNFYNF
jgi:hypothetical protein